MSEAYHSPFSPNQDQVNPIASLFLMAAIADLMVSALRISIILSLLHYYTDKKSSKKVEDLRRSIFATISAINPKIKPING